MYKFLISWMILCPLMSLRSQIQLDFQSTDSITYDCYIKGDWEKLISTGHQAIKGGVISKFLHQRMGYAYFVKKQYVQARNQYEKALYFDESDQNTRLYLYYCGINLGEDEYARFQLSKLSDETKKWLKIDDTRMVDAVDVEYNYKINHSGTRTNPIFYKTGINSILWNRLSLYQSFSQFFQTVNTASPAKQTEYLARANWLFSPNVLCIPMFTILYQEQIFFKQGLIPTLIGFYLMHMLPF
jgi:tetratricopeptide (TPR) repeat protein